MQYDLTKCRATEGGDNIITPKGRLSYPYLLATNPGSKTKKGQEKYTTSILLPPGCDLTLLKTAASVKASEAFGKEKVKSLMEINRFNVPFLDAFEKSRTQRNPAGEEWMKGWVLIRATSLQAPGIVGPNGKNIDGDSSMVYPGRWATLSLNPFTYNASEGGNSGVSFGLQNVQLLDHADRLGGGGARAEDEFGPVDIDGSAEGPAAGSADAVFDDDEIPF